MLRLPNVERESRRRLWILLAFYPFFVAAMVALALGVFVDDDDWGRGEWAEPIAIRVPVAVVCIHAATTMSRRRIRAPRSR
jgi:hypothetical protein